MISCNHLFVLFIFSSKFDSYNRLTFVDHQTYLILLSIELAYQYSWIIFSGPTTSQLASKLGESWNVVNKFHNIPARSTDLFGRKIERYIMDSTLSKNRQISWFVAMGSRRKFERYIAKSQKRPKIPTDLFSSKFSVTLMDSWWNFLASYLFVWLYSII